MLDALPDPLVCPTCHVLLRDGAHGLTCASCGHTERWEETQRPEDGDAIPGIRGA